MTGFMRGALAATALVGLFGTAAAAQDAGFYLKGFGGATFPQSTDFDFDTRPAGFTDLKSGLSYDTGYILGVAAGYNVTPNVAVELEYAFRNSAASIKNTGDAGKDGNSQSNAWMANALYKFTPMGPTGQWQPYVGGGLGMADLNIDGLDLNGDFDSDYQFAYQLIGGVGYAVTPQWTINGEVRFFGINDQDLENNDFSFKTTYKTIDLLLGATYAF